MDPAQFGYPAETLVVFGVVVAASLWLDLFAHRRRDTLSFRDAVGWSLFWIAQSLAFAVYLWFRFGHDAAVLFLSGWALEKALSLDNLMVFVAIFVAFGIKPGQQRRILHYGIVGALVFRLLFVAAGGTLLHALGPVANLVFAVFIGLAAYQMLAGPGTDCQERDYSKLLPVRVARRFFPTVCALDGERFVVDAARAAELDPRSVRPGARWYITPAFVCLLVVEWTDVMFSIDSVPVVIAVTHEPLLIYASMVFAILGLRSLYFVVEVLTRRLVYLPAAVGVLLVLIAAKLVLHGLNGLGELEWLAGAPWLHDLGLWEPSAEQSAAAIAATLGLGTIASLLRRR